MNKYEATSCTSSRRCELSHRVIARDGTWIDVRGILAEEETMEWSRCILFQSARSGFLGTRMVTFRCCSQDVSGN
nr:hypothetical protein [Evansella caseinilytica]